MEVQKLELTHFRNYEHCSIDNLAKVNLILGENGSGKTNLMDAVHYSCFGRSYFSSTDRKVVQWDKDFFRIEATILKDSEKFKIVAKVIPGKLKEISINGKKLKKVSEIIGLFPIIAISPKEIYALLLTSEARRKIIDQLICQYDKSYLQNLQRYHSLITRRNALLKQTERFAHLDLDLIKTFDSQMAPLAQSIYSARKELFEDMRPLFESYYQKICSEKEQGQLSYKSQLQEADLESLLSQRLEKDFHLNRTTAGIHKDDFVFMINDHPINSFGSQGQLKSFVIALKLSLFELLKNHNKQAPILLLDDIFDKFDELRTSALMEIIFDQNFGQVFITDANKNRMPDLLKNSQIDYKEIIIDKGSIQ